MPSTIRSQIFHVSKEYTYGELRELLGVPNDVGSVDIYIDGKNITFNNEEDANTFFVEWRTTERVK